MGMAAQLTTCLPSGSPDQAFQLDEARGMGFHVSARTSPFVCLQPLVPQTPKFDAVAFETPGGDVSVVVVNLHEADIMFDLYDVGAGVGAQYLRMPPHSIASYIVPAWNKQHDDLAILSLIGM